MRSAALAACLFLCAGCTHAPSGTVPASVTSPRSTKRAPGRVAVVVMENKEFAAVIGDPAAPYTNDLAHRSALATSYFAITHPSLPNYLALIGGDRFRIGSNCTTCHVDARNLVDQLDAAHLSWKAYMDGLPHKCFTGPVAGRYAKKHNPFVYFDDIVTDPSRCSKIAPLTDLSADETSGLPRFVWITPDLCHDTHDCSVRAGDEFLSKLLPPLIVALGKSGVVFLTYDEGSTFRGCCGDAAGGHIVTIATGPGARPGRYAQPLTHYSLLRAVEDHFRLPHLRRAAAAPDMRALLR